MKQKFSNHFILVLCISMALFACNQQEKKVDQATTTDSTGLVTTEAEQPASQDAPDAAKVSPDLYKVLSDTLGIRILEVTYKPGDASALHSHPDHAAYITEGGTIEFTESDGAKQVLKLKTGETLVIPAGTHSVKNSGTTTLKVILVEVNRPKETISQDAALDATKVSPGNYKLKRDTLGIRILEITYKPGQASAMHAHPDNALYVIEGGTTEFTAKDGNKQVITIKPGMAMVGPAEAHRVKNTGTNTTRAILIEVNRRRN